MKTFTQFIKEETPYKRRTADTLRAQDKFGSKNSFKQIGKGAPKGHQSLPGPKHRRPQ